MPTLRQLDYLVAIADTLHFRLAAKRVNTTQSTLSTQLKALETRLGLELVERTHSKVLLTPAGAEVVAVARRMLKDAHEIRDISKLRCGKLSGVLRLGVPPTIGPSLLPRIIPGLRKEFPQLRLFVKEDLPAPLSINLEQGNYDVIITPLPLSSNDICHLVLFDEPLFLVLGASHHLAVQKVITWSELKGIDVLALGPGHQCHDLVRSLCEASGARMLLDYEGTSLDMLREMVATGLGCTFMPALFVQARVVSDPSLVVRKIEGHRVSRTVAIAWRKAAVRPRELERLAKLIQEEIGSTFETTCPP